MRTFIKFFVGIVCGISFFTKVFAAGVPGFIDPNIYVTNATDQSYCVEWRISTVVNQKTVTVDRGGAFALPGINNKKLGHFGWFTNHQDHIADVNSVTITLYDEAHKKVLVSQQTIQQHLFVGADASKDKLLDLYVNIDKNGVLSVRVG